MEYEIKPAGRFTFNLQEVWDYRELIYFYTWRDIKVKYKQTVLGAAWAVIQPVLLMIIFTVFFARNLDISGSKLPYPVFVFSGLLLWNMFSNGLMSTGNSMVNNAHIIKKIYFPRLIIPIASVCSALIDFLIPLCVYGVLLVYYHFADRLLWFLLLLPLSVMITVLTTMGLGSFLAALNIKYRDFRYVMPFFIQVLMFVSPVIYPVSIIHIKWIQALLYLNPMSGAIDAIRNTITGSTINWNETLIGLAAALFLLTFGLAYFRKTEYYFADLA